jgi:phosphopantetheinyl transferase
MQYATNFVFMPLFYSQTIDRDTLLAIWQISEDETFFLEKVPLSRQITHPAKRLQHLAGRYLLQYLFPDFPLRLIQVADTRKPFLPEDPYHFSISHCGCYAAAIVSTTHRVGIDIEQPTQRILRIIPKFMSPTEQKLINYIRNEELLIRYGTLCWSIKEAMYKWYAFGKIDFIRDLIIESLEFENEISGIAQATCKTELPQKLTLPFVIWPNLILSWTTA